MKGIYNFIIEPKGERYNNTKKVGDSELILNTEIFNHHYINREAIVVSTPIINDTDIKTGDTVIVHHNVFRRWHNVKGIEKNSASYFKDNKYIVSKDQIFAYKRDGDLKCLDGYCFVTPLKETHCLYSDSQSERLMGVVKHSDKNINKGDLVGFLPIDRYEFMVNGERLYRIKSNDITIKYEYQGNEKEYNPSWAESS